MALVKIFLIDGLKAISQSLSPVLDGDPGIEVVGVASDVREALHRLDHLLPDAIVIELHSNQLEVLDLLPQLRDAIGIPVVLLSAAQQDTRFQKQVTAIPGVYLLIMDSGAPFEESVGESFSERIRKVLSSGREVTPASNDLSRANDVVVVIGASTGGQNALLQIVPRMPKEIPAAILVSLASRPGFTKVLAERLNHACKIPVSEAMDGDWIVPGEIKILPGGQPMIAEEDHSSPGSRICLRRCPLIGADEHVTDRLMGSLSALYGSNLVGVLLTGLGTDGIIGLKAIKAAGGVTLVEDPSTAVVADLPRAALEENVADKSVPLWYMAEEIRQTVGIIVHSEMPSARLMF